MKTRKNTSRSKELDIVIYSFRLEIEKFKKYITSNPGGGYYTSSNLFFKYGNIERLVDTINWDITDFKSPINDIVGIFHLDSISVNEKKSIENELSLQSGILTQKSKADILIVCKNSTLVLSFKDGTSVSKLGQVSTEMRYNNAILRGGLILPFPTPIEILDKTIDYKNTDLSSSQFDKLNYKDKQSAYIKHNYKQKWSEYVTNTCDEAIEQLIRFGKVITKDKDSLIHFILITLFGRINVPSYFNILINDKIILSENIIEFIKNKSYSVICEHYRTEKKFSLIINIIIDDVKYGITKIEPAFDGARSNVSQTKGIIYYFQQYPNSGNHIWQLLKDISK